MEESKDLEKFTPIFLKVEEEFIELIYPKDVIDKTKKLFEDLEKIN